MRRVGFSTGAVAYGDFRGALEMLRAARFNCVELSALRMSEVDELLEALPGLDLTGYSYVSFHAPSKIAAADEAGLAEKLYRLVPKDWPIVMHPDAISDVALWRPFGARLAIENMDRRKPIGRDVRELRAIFERLPEASFCFDVGHAHQCDSTMTESYAMLHEFGSRLVQVHVSEVNSESQHDPISYGAKIAFQQIADLISEETPLIVESRVGVDLLRVEAGRAIEALSESLVAEYV